MIAPCNVPNAVMDSYTAVTGGQRVSGNCSVSRYVAKTQHGYIV